MIRLQMTTQLCKLLAHNYKPVFGLFQSDLLAWCILTQALDAVWAIAWPRLLKRANLCRSILTTFSSTAQNFLSSCCVAST
jgi:hypothetical protein